jgi:4-hydroxy-tetrahydrodipicolinate reductase
MIKIAVVGFTGRINKLLIEEINKNPEYILSGVLVRKGCFSKKKEFELYDDIKELADNSDAIIDFSSPEASLSIAKQLVGSQTLLVCGTTGFTEEEFIQFKSYSKQAPILWSANMSLGINLLQSLLKIAASKLTKDFDPAIIDIHHCHKKDAPSGTAKVLAQAIENNRPPELKKVQVSSLRIGEEFGEHKAIFSGDNESISLSHKAFNRNSFVQGAIKACLWGKNKPAGFYTMQDVFQ